MRAFEFLPWCLLILSGSKFTTCASDDHEGRHLLRKCINDHQPNIDVIRTGSIGTTWRETLSDKGSKYVVPGAWWSKHGPKSSSPLAEGMTIVAHLSFDERSQLKKLCRSWQGPLSAAIHFTTLDTRAAKRNRGSAMRPTVPQWTEGQDDTMAESDDLDSSVSDYADVDPGSMEIAESSIMKGESLGRNSAIGATEPIKGRGMDSMASGSNKRSITKRRGRTLLGSARNDAGNSVGGAGSASLGDSVLSIDEAKRHVKGVHEALERMNACQADIILVHEVYSDQRSLAMYPGPLLQVDMDAF